MENFLHKGDFMDETFTVTDDGRLVCYVAVEFHFYTKFVTSFVRFVLNFLEEALPLSIRKISTFK